MDSLIDHSNDLILELRQGATVCQIAPYQGCALLSLSIGGNDVLRKTAIGSTNVSDTACFPLVPFANRIADGRFTFEDCEINIPADPAALPHAHHGHGWRRSWRVSALSASEATMEYSHQADGWPWSYCASQRLSVHATGLEIELEVTNLSDRLMPCGFGLHPYFELVASSYIVIDAPECLYPDGRGIPCIVGPGLIGRHELSGLGGFDALLLDASGRVVVGTLDWEIDMLAEQAVGWQFYLPPERHYFCVEPVSHRPNALDCFAGRDVLSPGGCRRWKVLIQRTR